jgi:hypothetical protein
MIIDDGGGAASCEQMGCFSLLVSNQVVVGKKKMTSHVRADAADAPNSGTVFTLEKLEPRILDDKGPVFGGKSARTSSDGGAAETLFRASHHGVVTIKAVKHCDSTCIEYM